MLRVEPLILTDGFYMVEAEGLHSVQTNYFVRLQQWRIQAKLQTLKLIVAQFVVLGRDTMSDIHIKPLKMHPEVRACLAPVFRTQLRAQVPEMPAEYILARVSKVV